MAARFVFRIHAVQRMSERGISEQDVREILSAGESMESTRMTYRTRAVWC